MAIGELDSAAATRLEERSDRELVTSFAARGDGPAFAALVRRHGPMVLGVCRQLLADRHEAEDAFQVTFMVLARKAGSIRQPERLGGWLHGVALRSARKTRALAFRLRAAQSLEDTMRDADGGGGAELQELRLRRSEEYRALHEEIGRLPEKYRLAVVHCYLEGLSQVQAARCLGCPSGTISVRLMRARALLRARLTRRGLTPVAGMLAAATMVETAQAEVTAELADATVHAGLRFAAGVPFAAGSVPATATVLAHEVLAGLTAESLIAAGPIASLLGVLVLAGLGAFAFVCGSRQAADRTSAGAPVPKPAALRNPAETLPAPLRRPPAIGPDGRPFGRAATSSSNRSDGSRDAAPMAGLLETYRRLAEAAAGDADAQVRLALWCEACGLDSERTRHLSLAIAVDPDHARARGLLGLVAYRGQWRSPVAVSAQVRADDELAATLEEYHARRQRTPRSADSQWRLANWCTRQGLDAEATAHLKTVVQLDPGHEAAWKRLGFKRHNGRWFTEAQLAAARAESEARRKADRLWRPLLSRWRGWLADPSRRDEAERGLAGVSDPYALPAIWFTFGAGSKADRATAVRLLGQIDGPLAARMLGVVAFSCPWDEVRRAASETLLRRDAREAVTLLVTRLRDPDPPADATVVRYQWVPVGSRWIGSPGVTYVEGRRANVLRAYTVDESFRPAFTTLAAADYGQRLGRQHALQQSDLETIVALLVDDALREFQAKATPIREVNARLIQTLRNITGEDRGDRWDSWTKWWIEGLGYAYDPRDFAAPPDVEWYAPKPTHVSFAHFSCFAASTPVLTLGGQQPIESIRIGDQVLTRNATTGALGYAPVLAVMHNKPAPTLRIGLGGVPVVATGIHRFWKVGRGWVMARDLKPGDSVRTVDGRVRVSSVSPDSVQPVFNLEVGEDQSFFVGPHGALVHDSSEVEPVSRPFDSVAGLSTLKNVAH